MKIATKTLTLITSLLILFLVVMTACSIPKGPWPMPPGDIPKGLPSMPPGYKETEDTIKSGKPTEATFWVTVPYNTPREDNLLLAITGQEPIEMKKVGELSWKIAMGVKGGEELSYKYLRGSEKSYSSQYEVKITRENQKIYDGVSGWNDLPFKPKFPDGFVISIYMFDTWGRNYNFNWFEDTRKNIASSFKRVAETGVEEVYVHDFFMANYGEGNRMGSTDYSIEGEMFDNDKRDEVMTQSDLDSLAKEAKANGLKIGWRSSMHFVDIGKYMGSPNITAEVAKDWEQFSKPKTEEWVKDYLTKWKQIMLERAEMLNKAGFDIMILTPHYMTPNYYPHEELANEMWQDIIRSVKEVFNGQVGVVVNRYGFLEGICGQEDWSRYDYYQEADAVYYSIFRLLLDKYQTSKNPSLEEMREKFVQYLDDLEKRASEDGIKLSIIATLYSYENAINNGIAEFSDIGNPEIQALKADWQHQANAYEALFQAAQGRTNIARIVAFGYWWDDAMDPETAKPMISISFSQRNKNAEGVIKKWAISLK